MKRHLGTEEEAAALRATAEKVAAFWSKETRPPDRSASVAQAEQPERDKGRGEEVMETENDVVAPSRAEALENEGDNNKLRSEEDER